MMANLDVSGVLASPPIILTIQSAAAENVFLEDVGEWHKVKGMPRNNKQSQCWKFEEGTYQYGSRYRLRNMNSGMYLAIPRGRKGDLVCIGDDDFYDLWQFSSTRVDGALRLKSAVENDVKMCWAGPNDENHAAVAVPIDEQSSNERDHLLSSWYFREFDPSAPLKEAETGPSSEELKKQLEDANKKAEESDKQIAAANKKAEDSDKLVQELQRQLDDARKALAASAGTTISACKGDAANGKMVQDQLRQVQTNLGVSAGPNNNFTYTQGPGPGNGRFTSTTVREGLVVVIIGVVSITKLNM